MVGLIDGSLSTLAPIFSVALVSHKPLYAFVAGLATSIGAAISMAFSEGLSDTGELTGPRQPARPRRDHRRRHVPRRDPAHAAVPDPELPRRDRDRDRRRRVRAGRARLDPLAVLRTSFVSFARSVAGAVIVGSAPRSALSGSVVGLGSSSAAASSALGPSRLGSPRRPPLARPRRAPPRLAGGFDDGPARPSRPLLALASATYSLVDELEVDHLGGVARARADLDDPRVAAGPVREARRRPRRTACGRCPASAGTPSPAGGRACRRAGRA